jgi:hypothetical protein
MTRGFRSTTVTLVLLVLLAVTPQAGAKSPVSAACQALVHPVVSAIRISGVVGETGGFARTLHLAIAHKAHLSITHRGLHGAAAIDESQITAEQTIQAHSRTVVIAVADLSDPGTYRGYVTLASGARRCTLPMVVEAREQPQITPVSGGAISLELTRCWRICPGTGHVTATLTDAGRALVEATNGRLKAYRHQDGARLDGVTTVGIQLSGRDAGSLTLATDKHKLRPGHYDGVVLLQVAGESAPVGIPAGVDVKDGRTLPLIIIALAFLVRLLAGYWRKTAAVQRSREALVAAARATGELPTDDGLSLVNHLREARRLWDAGDTAGAADRVALVTKSTELLLEARELLARTSPTAQQQVNLAVVNLRTAIAEGDQTGIDSAIAAVRQAAHAAGPVVLPNVALPAPPPGGVGPTTVSDLSETTFGEALVAYLKRIVQVRDHLTNMLGNGLELVIVLALVFGILNDVYFTNTTFGADLLKDYGTLFVTALGATAVGKLVAGVVGRSILASDV